MQLWAQFSDVHLFSIAQQISFSILTQRLSWYHQRVSRPIKVALVLGYRIRIYRSYEALNASVLPYQGYHTVKITSVLDIDILHIN